MKRLLRAGVCGAVGLMMALAMSASPAPARAAGVKLYVDDDGANNMGVSCPATPYTNLQAAVAALGGTTSNVTITMCPGHYPAATNHVIFSGFTNLKLIGKGGPTIEAAGFSGGLIMVELSTRVTISGLVISGGANLGTVSTSTTAIFFNDSSGLIRGNVITDWHQSFSTPLTNYQNAIVVLSSSTSDKVTIDKNTIFDPQDNGIIHYGPATAKITKNRVVMHSDIDVINFMQPGPDVHAGIMLLFVGAGSQVTGNIIESNSGMEPYPCTGLLCPVSPDSTRGILLLQASGVKVTGNKVSHTLYGISVESWCYGSHAPHADGNTISGNKLYNNQSGVYVHAQDYKAGACVAHADNNVIKSNKFDHNSIAAGGGVSFDATAPDSVSGNKVTGNTFTGFFTTPLDMTFYSSGTGVSGSVVSGNKVSNMPLAGPLP